MSILGSALSRAAQNPLSELIQNRLLELHMNLNYFIVPNEKLSDLSAVVVLRETDKLTGVYLSGNVS